MLLRPCSSLFSAGCVDIGDLGCKPHSGVSKHETEDVFLCACRVAQRLRMMNNVIVWEDWVGHKASLVQSCPTCPLAGLRNEEICTLHIHVLGHGGLPAGLQLWALRYKMDGYTGESLLKGHYED